MQHYAADGRRRDLCAVAFRVARVTERPQQQFIAVDRDFSIQSSIPRTADNEIHDFGKSPVGRIEQLRRAVIPDPRRQESNVPLILGKAGELGNSCHARRRRQGVRLVRIPCWIEAD